jgi:FkbM family methyltransferase
MNRTIIRAVKAIFHFFGMELHWVRKGVGVDAFRDMRYLSAVPDPVVFDGGANVGQSVERFHKYFPRPVIHSFEPGGAAFKELTRATAGVPDLRLNNFGLASQAGSRTFIENDRTDMSSLLEPGSDCWGEITRTYSVDVSTVDEYCAKTGIERIDILKIDTQGSELDVIKGAQAMIRKGAIHLIYLEIIFSEMYKGLPRLDEVYGFLADRGYTLVAFYDFWYQRERAAWTDALFIHSAYVR